MGDSDGFPAALYESSRALRASDTFWAEILMPLGEMSRPGEVSGELWTPHVDAVMEAEIGFHLNCRAKPGHLRCLSMQFLHCGRVSSHLMRWRDSQSHEAKFEGNIDSLESLFACSSYIRLFPAASVAGSCPDRESTDLDFVRVWAFDHLVGGLCSSRRVYRHAGE